MRSVKKCSIASEISLAVTSGWRGHRRASKGLMSTTGGGWGAPAVASIRSGCDSDWSFGRGSGMGAAMLGGGAGLALA